MPQTFTGDYQHSPTGETGIHRRTSTFARYRSFTVTYTQGVAEFDRQIQRGDSRHQEDETSPENIWSQTTFSR
ncbi:hypothetical protein AVEN_206024-1, partial [Araneus ventricosus]